MTPRADSEKPVYISRSVALRFLTYPGSVHLGTAKRISAAAARILAKHQGELRLSGLNALTEASGTAFFEWTAQAVSRHRG